ncbi:response regulator [Leptospira fluminis]|uniref:Response regulator n=1 Tax=Leptospira fluminis TaxID=2484979 RepID=A0A4R9GP58_9LEPT|nr:response regulator [Leptospira fluminis]TGK18731.1 response regulator [Leptospira fluminis]
MNTLINCIMLIDDNSNDNFIHDRVIKKNGFANIVIALTSAVEALNYLKQQKEKGLVHPDLIFLDINMPGMNGWEFLVEYDKLDGDLQGKIIIIMLTTSDNPDDQEKARNLKTLSDFKTKPLTKEMLSEISVKYFPF